MDDDHLMNARGCRSNSEGQGNRWIWFHIT